MKYSALVSLVCSAFLLSGVHGQSCPVTTLTATVTVTVTVRSTSVLPTTTTTRTTTTTTTSVVPTTTTTTTTTTTSKPPTSTQTNSATGVVFSDGFEDGLGSTWTLVQPTCAGSGTAAIDSSFARTGSKSLKVNGAGSFCNHIFAETSAISSLSSGSAYVRFWIYHTTALPTDHTTFITMVDDNDGGRNIRMGGQSGILDWNRESDDATCPSLSPNGIAQTVTLPTNSWQCFEYMISNTGKLSAWLNEAAIVGMTVDGVATTDIDAAWVSGKPNWAPKVSVLRLGWESYASASNTVWYDDVVIGSSRIGCGGSVPPTSPPPSTTTTTRGASTVTSATRTSTASASPSPPSGTCSAKYAQCGGQGWAGPTCCVSGSTCNKLNDFYSQCV
ncbi:hypothetical protein BJ742DRAFT_806649 [Cladochytrium replicatum]|nr:hypothetical protein BJ742DRAFT_806649 [Cladochytrium replicatum]